MPRTEDPALLPLLEEVLEAMLMADEDVTARGIVRRGLFKHPTDITRSSARRALLERYKARQAEVRRVAEKTQKTSRTNLSRALAEKQAEIERLTRQRDLLVASHKAMILAVGEMGGMAAWRRFFEGYEAVVEELRGIDALPEGEARPLVQRKGVRLP